jgi:hypothetical protein
VNPGEGVCDPHAMAISAVMARLPRIHRRARSLQWGAVMNLSKFLIPIVTIIAFPSMASAADVVAAPENGKPEAEVPQDISLRAGLGVFANLDSKDAGGHVFGTVLYRRGLFLAGATGGFGGAVWGFNYTTGAATSGVALPVPSWARVEILGLGGVHVYDNVGRAFLSADPGVSGTLPFVGARAHLGVALGGRGARIGLGLEPFLETDIGRQSKTTTFPMLFNVPGTNETVTHTVGAARAGVMLALGGTFGM